MRISCSLAGSLADHRPRHRLLCPPSRLIVGGRRPRHPLHPVAPRRDEPLPYMVVLQVTPIIAIAPLIFILHRQPHRARALHRLDYRWVLPGAVEHRPWPEVLRPQPPRPHDDLPREPLAAAALPPASLVAAPTFSGACASRVGSASRAPWWPSSTMGVGRAGGGPRLPHSRVELPAQRAAHVRPALLLVHSSPAWRSYLVLSFVTHLLLAQMARERREAGTLMDFRTLPRATSH